VTYPVQDPNQIAYYVPETGRWAGRVSYRSRMVAAVLGFFFGALGVDRFYLGNIGMGVAKLLVGWLTLGIWPLIDWIIILAGSAHDGDGLPVKNWN
jgi:TM2 domain-containing membrane protein YozV